MVPRRIRNYFPRNIYTPNKKETIEENKDMESFEKNKDMESFEKNQMDCKIISYYADFTPTPYYEKFAKELERKCVLFGVDYDICKLGSRGSYGANCLMKPEFILNKIIEHKKPVIWMDCDTDFRNPFSNFNGIKDDIGMASHNGEIGWITASPIYFNYTPGSFRLIREWLVHCRAAFIKNLPELDHDALKHYVLRVLKGKYSAYILSDNHNDFVYGKYISNGNSRIEGKNDIHSKMKLVTDSNRDSYTAGIPLIKIYFDGLTSKNIESPYNFLKKFSNYNRMEIVIPQELSKSTDFYQLMIETGDSVKFMDLNYNNIEVLENQIFLSVIDVKDIEKDWDERIRYCIDNGLNPLHDLNFTDGGNGSIKIKTNKSSWI
jgi:hypothetical protein